MFLTLIDCFAEGISLTLPHVKKYDDMTKASTNKKDAYLRTEKEQIASGLKRWGQDAYRKALLDGHSTVVLKGNKVYRVTSSGATDVVAEVPQSKYKITQRSFDLSK